MPNTPHSKPWYLDWFNKDYFNLYAYRHDEEAKVQVDFLQRVLHLKGDEKILDLGCGIGRHAILLGQLGCHITGVDISPYCIAEANKKLAPFPDIDVKFMQRDMRQLDDLGTFDAVISMFTSFGYFDEDEDNEQVLEAVRRCLNSGGQFFLDYLHPYHVKATFVPEEELTVIEEKVIIQRKITDDHIVKTIIFPDRSYQEKVKLYSKDNIESVLLKHRLRPMDKWNDYQGNLWKEKGNRQLFRFEAY